MNTDIPLCFPVGYAEGCESAQTLVCLCVSNRETNLRELTHEQPRFGTWLFDSVHV